jgi:hypothetical protein
MNEGGGVLSPQLTSASAFETELAPHGWKAEAKDALRHIEQQERQPLAYVYASHDIYNRMLAEEMNHWTALAAAEPGDAAVELWIAFAQRVAISACIATIRIERLRNPQLPTARLQPLCQRYGLSIPPAQLYRPICVPMPNTSWRPGQEY